MRARLNLGPDTLKVVAAFFAIYVVWGSTYLAIKVLVETVPPLTAAGIRFFVAGVLLYAWGRVRGAPKPSRQQWPRLLAMGALMFVPTYSALFWAERTIPSGLAAVLAATLPIWMLLVEIGVLKRQRLTVSLVVALAIGFVGVLLVTGVGGGPSVPWLPCIAVVTGEVFWAVGSVIRKNFDLPKASTIAAGGEMICGGCLLLVLGGAVGEWRTIPTPTVGALVAMGYLIVVGSIIAYNSYVWLLGRTSATRLASYTYVNPVVALAIGFQFGGERLTTHAIYGSLLVLISVALILWSTRSHDERTGATPAPVSHEASRASARVA